MQRVKLAQATALTGYFGLIFLLLLWNIWIAPSKHFPISLVLIVLVVPLLFPLRGLLHGRSYTYAWSSMLSLLYLALGIMEAVTKPYEVTQTPERLLGIIEIIFSVMLFVGAILYVRLKARADRAAALEEETKD
ncbi:hypothetical protein BOW53_03860 [Solemya pervernicosa gill symbiont]|uniref:DUF2069 domain-containing protein n=2 Tax=Gammaproteobacteria incertae sedis TaxID=118884 RepID=A0A1T2L8N4_9GAMM|nr:DUF2069 domain-containing protein [Candidatus Reidiella endopervernicosa]OOZ41392.1 hypothetical protein BOW53_03860 [Solemya pervernicosa gill symbiont]QKQ27569.1 DUF2069 domain-containing protein [Candidatus Reidiella endopervernicosa]